MQTARQAFVAAVVALAIAAPTPFVLEWLLQRPSVEAPTPASTAVAAEAARSGGALGTTAPSKRAAGPAKPRPSLPGPGLPGSLAQSLKASPVVVVALYAAGDTIDMAASAEAEAGAELAGAPYVPINVGDESQIGDLAARLPDLAVPATVIFGHGGRVLAQIDGYADRQAIAEAIDGARPRPR